MSIRESCLPLPRDAPGRELLQHAEDRGILPLAPQNHGEVRPRPAMFEGNLPQAARVHPVAPVRPKMGEHPLTDPGECCALTWWNVHR